MGSGGSGGSGGDGGNGGRSSSGGGGGGGGGGVYGGNSVLGVLSTVYKGARSAFHSLRRTTPARRARIHGYTPLPAVNTTECFATRNGVSSSLRHRWWWRRRWKRRRQAHASVLLLGGSDDDDDDYGDNDNDDRTDAVVAPSSRPVSRVPHVDATNTKRRRRTGAFSHSATNEPDSLAAMSHSPSHAEDAARGTTMTDGDNAVNDDNGENDNANGIFTGDAHGIGGSSASRPELARRSAASRADATCAVRTSADVYARERARHLWRPLPRQHANARPYSAFSHAATPTAPRASAVAATSMATPAALGVPAHARVPLRGDYGGSARREFAAAERRARADDANASHPPWQLGVDDGPRHASVPRPRRVVAGMGRRDDDDVVGGDSDGNKNVHDRRASATVYGERVPHEPVLRAERVDAQCGASASARHRGPRALHRRIATLERMAPPTLLRAARPPAEHRGGMVRGSSAARASDEGDTAAASDASPAASAASTSTCGGTDAQRAPHGAGADADAYAQSAAFQRKLAIGAALLALEEARCQSERHAIRHSAASDAERRLRQLRSSAALHQDRLAHHRRELMRRVRERELASASARAESELAHATDDDKTREEAGDEAEETAEGRVTMVEKDAAVEERRRRQQQQQQQPPPIDGSDVIDLDSDSEQDDDDDTGAESAPTSAVRAPADTADAATAGDGGARAATAFRAPSVIDERDPLSPLTPHAEAQLAAAALDAAKVDDEDSARASRAILVSAHGIKISRDEMRRLRPGEWLTDNIINMYCQHLLRERQERVRAGAGVAAPNGHRDGAANGYDDGAANSVDCGAASPCGETRPTWPRCHFFSTFFYARLTSGGCDGVDHDPGDAYDYEGVRRWTRRTDVLAADRILVPINIGNVHWTLAVVDLRAQQFQYYDSLGGNGKAVLHVLQRWLVDEARDKRGAQLAAQLAAHTWRMVHVHVPRQVNCSDCGMFAAKFADYVSRGVALRGDTFDAAHMAYFRRRTAHELLVGRAGG